MSFALVIIGIVLLVSAIRNTQGDLFTLVRGDFTGSGNFIYWVVAILIIGAVGYIEKLKPFSVAFLTLVILVLFLTKGNPKNQGGGFFQQFQSALGSTTKTSPQSPAPGLSTSSSATLSFPQTNTSQPSGVSTPGLATLTFPQ